MNTILRNRIITGASGIVNWLVTLFADFDGISVYNKNTNYTQATGKKCAMVLTAPTPSTHTANRYHTFERKC